MWRSGYCRLSLSLLVGVLAVPLLTADARAGDKESKSSARVGTKLSERALGELMGPFKFGMSKQDVLRTLSRQINERYKERIAGTSDVYVQDKLRRDRQGEFDRIKKSYVEFQGKKTGWDVSIVDDQFAHNTSEAMMVHWENSAESGRDQRRFFFFHKGQLYKMFIALNSQQLKNEQRSFTYFQNLMEQRYGAGKVHADKGIIEWKSSTYRVLAVDKLDFYGSFCLVISDPEEDGRLASKRAANKKAKPENKVIKAVMSKDEQEDTPGLNDNRSGVEGVVGGGN
jgi:hypothetical protein